MTNDVVAAVVLAAGLSRRMGRSKPLLPFGAKTVIERIVDALAASPVADIVVVTGRERAAVEARLAGGAARCAFNPDFESGEMRSSIQVGLRALNANAAAALIALGDQPNLATATAARTIEAWRGSRALFVRPSFGGRPGHPVLLDRRLWPDVLALRGEETLRDLLRSRKGAGIDVPVDDAGILNDIDTPDDYARERC